MTNTPPTRQPWGTRSSEFHTEVKLQLLTTTTCLITYTLFHFFSSMHYFFSSPRVLPRIIHLTHCLHSNFVSDLLLRKFKQKHLILYVHIYFSIQYLFSSHCDFLLQTQFSSLCFFGRAHPSTEVDNPQINFFNSSVNFKMKLHQMFLPHTKLNP